MVVHRAEILQDFYFAFPSTLKQSEMSPSLRPTPQRAVRRLSLFSPCPPSGVGEAKTDDILHCQ